MWTLNAADVDSFELCLANVTVDSSFNAHKQRINIGEGGQCVV